MIRAAVLATALILTSTPTALGVPQPPAKLVMSAKPVRETPELAKRVTRIMAASRGMDRAEIKCLFNIWQRESNFRPRALNRTPVKTADGWKHAGGVPQILGLDPKLPVHRQIARGLDYVEARYGSACKAWRFWQRKNWY